MTRATKRFPASTVAEIKKVQIIGLRAGMEPHRFIGLWCVVVEDRVFVRSWSIKERSWFRVFLEDPRGAITVGKRELNVRAVRTRSDRLKDAVDRAYFAKYNTPASQHYCRDLSGEKSRGTTTELVPR